MGLYLLCFRVLELAPAPDLPGERSVVPLVAAALFALHPTGSGVVHYFSARSSLLTAAFLLPALLVYMVPVADARYARPPWVALAFYGLALLTKLEAVGCLGAFLAYEVWQRAREGGPSGSFFACLARALDRRTLFRLGPFLLATAASFAWRRLVMSPYPFAALLAGPDTGPGDYLLTQAVVWWVYVRQWVAPVGLVADDHSFHVCRSVLESPVALALAGMTRERNLVYRTEASYWLDVLEEAPSARAHNNYGLALLAQGDEAAAHEHFVKAQALGPNWYVANVNLGLSLARRGRRDLARGRLDHAVSCEVYSGVARTWRGEFLLGEAAWAAALDDFLASAPLTVDNYRNWKGAATAAAGLARAGDALAYYGRCLDAAPARAAGDIVAVATPFFGDAAHLAAGVAFFRGLEARLPGAWWVQANLARLTRQREGAPPAASPRGAP